MTILPNGEWREALGSLSGEPASDWRSRLVHHGARAALLLGFAAAVPVLFPRAPLPQFAHMEEGMVASEDVIAEIGFPVMKSPERLRQERGEAERAVAPIFSLAPAAVDSSVRNASRFFTAVDSAREASEDTAAVRRTVASFGVEPSPEQVALLAAAGERRVLHRAIEDVFRSLLPQGVAPSQDVADVSSSRVVVRGPERDRRVARDSLVTLGDFYGRAAEQAPDRLDAPGMQLFQTLLVRFTVPSLRLDRAATEAARQQARQAVETTAGFVLEGERIVAAHERVGSAEMERLRAYREELSRRGIGEGEQGFFRDIGTGLYALTLLVLLGGVLLLFRPRMYRDLDDFSLTVALLFTVVLVSSFLGQFETPSPLVPVAFGALLIGALYDGLLALVAVGVVAGILAGQPAFAGATAPFLTLAAGAAAALGVRGVHRRSESWILIALIAGAYTVGGMALVLMRSLPVGDLITIAGWGSANAAVCTLFALAVLPALERFTGITTDQTLLELSDLNRPLLRRLSREAPGTYAHSIGVANLAEAACADIGADSLLARTGVYYHDIGKMARPQFFIENQPEGRNPHDRIPPAKSAEVIRGHVTEGLRMARDARLPEAVQDFIREHHGTMTISYFLEKARQQATDEEPDPEEFRYPGPRPRSRETAVVMLADGVESACRTLADPTPERIGDLIDGIVEARIAEGQLDDSPLTLRDLDRIREQFARVLTGMYHRRIDYPDAEQPGEKKRAPERRTGEESGARRERNGEAVRVARREGNGHPSDLPAHPRVEAAVERDRPRGGSSRRDE